MRDFRKQQFMDGRYFLKLCMLKSAGCEKVIKRYMN